MESVLIPSVRVPMETRLEPPPRHILKIALDQRGKWAESTNHFQLLLAQQILAFRTRPPYQVLEASTNNPVTEPTQQYSVVQPRPPHLTTPTSACSLMSDSWRPQIVEN